MATIGRLVAVLAGTGLSLWVLLSAVRAVVLPRGEVVLLTGEFSPSTTVHIDAIRPDGTTKWATTIQGDHTFNSSEELLSIGDVDGDGITDVLYQQNSLWVLSGSTGSMRRCSVSEMSRWRS